MAQSTNYRLELTSIAPEIRNAIFKHLFKIESDIKFSLHEDKDLYFAPNGPSTEILRTCHLLYDEAKPVQDAMACAVLATSKVILDFGDILSELPKFPFFDKYCGDIKKLEMQHKWEEFDDGFEAFTSLEAVTLNYGTEIELFPGGDAEDIERQFVATSDEEGDGADECLQVHLQTLFDSMGHDNVLDSSGGADAWIEYLEKPFGTERKFKMYAVVRYDVAGVGHLEATFSLDTDPYSIVEKKWMRLWKEEEHDAGADQSETSEGDGNESGD